MWILERLGVPVSRFDSVRIAFAAAWPTWVLYACLVACAVALVWTWLAVRRLRGTAPKVTVMLLRAAVLGCVVMILFEPQLQLRKSARIKNRLAVLVDVSASMGVKDQPGGLTRAQAISTFLRRNQAYFDQLDERFEVAYFEFGQELSSVQRATLLDVIPTHEGGTDVVGALRTLTERYAGARPQAVFLFSDGADNAISAPLPEKKRMLAQILERLKAPIFCLAPMVTKGFCDLAVTKIEYEDIAFVRSAWTASATVKAIGCKGRPIPVSLMQGRSVIASHTITPKGEVAEESVKFTFTPIQTGKIVLTVSLPVYAEEAMDANNAYSVPVRVIRDKTRVLHLCGRPSWDERFLRQALKQDPNVDLVSLFILRTPSDYRAVPPSELSLIPFPENALYIEHLREFDVVIFQNFNYRPYGLTRYLPNLRRFVQEYGGALVMIGGDLSFSEGLYANTPIAEVLPVEIPSEQEQMDTAKFQPQLTEAGRHHVITTLTPDPEANDKMWKALPAWDGCNKVLRLKPSAVALATHPSITCASGPMPVIAIMETGSGRTLAITSDSTWRWGLPALAQMGTMRPYFTFWHNALRWLIKDPELNQVRIQTDRDIYDLGQKVHVTVSVFDRSYRAAARVPVRLKLTGPAPKSALAYPDAVTNDKGICDFSFTPSTMGIYNIEAVAQFKDAPQNSAVESIVVQRTGDELRDITTNSELLTFIAENSGGKVFFLPAENFPSDVKIADPYIARVLEKEDIPLWDNWIAMTLIVTLLCGEWWIRKRSGLP